MTNKIEVGKVYTTKNGSKWTCIVKMKGFNYFIRMHNEKVIEGSTAFAWVNDGSSVSLPSEYNIDWSVEPTEMEITE